MTLILSNEEIEGLLTMPEVIATLEEAYIELAEGRGVTRTRSDILTPTKRKDTLYALKSMDGVAPKLGVGAIRINSDIVTWPKSGGGTLRRVKVPAAPGKRYVGLVLLFSTETGEPLAIFPDGVVQRFRVGAANGLAARLLARKDATTVGLIGSGWQAGAQAMAIAAVRELLTIRCYSPNKTNREAFCREWAPKLPLELLPIESPEAALEDADIALCATSSLEPVFFERWVRPGLHISSIKRPEVEPAAIKRADRVVVHSRDATPLHFTTRDLELPEKTKGKGWSMTAEVDIESLPTLPELLAGQARGRQSDSEVTCFLNNLGLGYQFAAIGALVHRKALAAKVGRELPTEWFTEDVHP